MFVCGCAFYSYLKCAIIDEISSYIRSFTLISYHQICLALSPFLYFSSFVFLSSASSYICFSRFTCVNSSPASWMLFNVFKHIHWTELNCSGLQELVIFARIHPSIVELCWCAHISEWIVQPQYFHTSIIKLNGGNFYDNNSSKKEKKVNIEKYRVKRNCISLPLFKCIVLC